MDSLSLTRSCGGTFFRGLSNPSVLHPLARSRQSEELLRAAFSSAVIGTTVTLSAFYAGRVLFVVPSKDEHTLFSQVLDDPPHYGATFTWLEYPNAVPRKMDLFSEDTPPFGSSSSPFCRSDSENLERAFDTLRYEHDLKILGVPSVVTRSTASGPAPSSGTSTYYTPTRTPIHDPVVTSWSISPSPQGSQENDGDDEGSGSDSGYNSDLGRIGPSASTLLDDPFLVHPPSPPPPPPPPPPPSLTGDEDDDYGAGWFPESAWKFLTYGALFGLMIRLARKYRNNDSLKILADVELELGNNRIPVGDLGLDVNTVDVVPASGTHTSAPASSSDVELFYQAVHGDSPSQCLSDSGHPSATEAYVLYQTSPVFGNGNGNPKATGTMSGIINVILAFFGLLLCIMPTFGFGYTRRPGFSHSVQNEVPTAQRASLDDSACPGFNDHEHAEHTASVDASEELNDSLENSYEVEVGPSGDLTPALAPVPTLSSDTDALDEISLGDAEELSIPPTVGTDTLDGNQGGRRVDDATENPIQSLIPNDDIAEATMGSPGIRSVSSISDTSMAAEELSRILQAASEVVEVHIRNVMSGSVQGSPKSDTSSISTDRVSNAAEEETLHASIWAPRASEVSGPLVDEGQMASPSLNPQAAPFEPGRISTPTKVPRRKRARRRPCQAGSEIVKTGQAIKDSRILVPGAGSPQPIRAQSTCSTPSSDGEDWKPRNHRGGRRGLGIQDGTVSTPSTPRRRPRTLSSSPAPDWANAP